MGVEGGSGRETDGGGGSREQGVGGECGWGRAMWGDGTEGRGCAGGRGVDEGRERKCVGQWEGGGVKEMCVSVGGVRGGGGVVTYIEGKSV